MDIFSQYPADFSVVRFRSDFMLASEEHPMKVHKNQRVCTCYLPLRSFVEPRTRAHTLVSGGQTPSQWLDGGRFPRDVALQPLENKALSRGITRKSAYILAEITLRKSQ